MWSEARAIEIEQNKKHKLSLRGRQKKMAKLSVESFPFLKDHYPKIVITRFLKMQP